MAELNKLRGENTFGEIKIGDAELSLRDFFLGAGVLYRMV